MMDHPGRISRYIFMLEQSDVGVPDAQIHYGSTLDDQDNNTVCF